MFESFTHTDQNDAIAIILADHAKVKDLFDEFENVPAGRAKQTIVAKAIMELKIHAEIEENIFYPAIRKAVKAKLMNEADEEHHIAKVLIAELEHMDSDEGHWEAKFRVLAENIRHHIGEEETDIIPQACDAKIDMIALGKRMLNMKHELMQKGVPPSDEEKGMGRKKADSPARMAKTKSATVNHLKPRIVEKKKTSKPMTKQSSVKNSSEKKRRYA